MRPAYSRQNMSHIPPLPIRKLRSQMELKALSLKRVADAADVNYSVASSILSGKRVDPTNLAKLSKAIKDAPEPAAV